MSAPGKSRRFQVALSFPGEHRDRIENITNLLARYIPRDQILYDHWHAAEFNRPNLDVYLPKLYHDESDLIVVFPCKEYDKSRLRPNPCAAGGPPRCSSYRH